MAVSPPSPRDRDSAVRYWRLRIILEIVKFTGWVILFPLWTLVQRGWDAVRDLL